MYARKCICALIYMCHASSNGPCVCAINAESLRRHYNLGEMIVQRIMHVNAPGPRGMLFPHLFAFAPKLVRTKTNILILKII